MKAKKKVIPLAPLPPSKRRPSPHLSKNLALRTKLTPEQLQRVKGQAGHGLASRYDKDGNQSLQLTRNLLKAKRKAKRLVLYTDQLGRRLYIADSAKIKLRGDEALLTFDKAEALHFYEGFDDIVQACRYWSLSIHRGQLITAFNTLNFISTHL